MSDGEPQEHVRRWLTDDVAVLNGVLIVAASSVALVFASLCVWRGKHYHVHTEPTTRDHRGKHLDSPTNTSTAQSMLTAALSSLHIISVSPGEYNMPPADQPMPSDSPSTLDVEQKDRKAPRPKERRRRGKDPYKDLFKGGKKSKSLLKATRADEHGQRHGRSTSPLPEADSKSETAGSVSASRSQSSDSASRDPPRRDRVALPANAEADNDSVESAGSHTSPAPAVPSSSNVPNSDFPSRSDIVGQYPVPNDQIITPDTEMNVSSSSATIINPAKACLSYPSGSISGSRTTQSLHTWEVDFQAGSRGANASKPGTKPRMSPLDDNTKPQASSSMPSVSFNGLASPFSSVLSTASSPSSSLASSPCMPPVTFPSLNPLPIDARDSIHSTSVNGVGLSTPLISRGPRPSESRSLLESMSQVPGPTQLNSQAQTDTPVSAQTQLASMRGALEAARRREEKLRVEVGRASKEYEELRWRWNEDAGSWRRREAELQTQIHHLMQQLQAYAALASFQAQQAQAGPSSSFSSPTSPSHTHRHPSPNIQHHPLIPFPVPPSLQSQNSASAPAHVQALLASAPMLPSHHQGFGAIGAGGIHAGMSAGMSPLLWSGLGFGAPNKGGARGVGQLTPDSSASGSPSRGRRRRRQDEDVRSASDDSSLGEWDGVEESLGPNADEGDCWERGEDPLEDADDVFRNNMLADAILKRPESIRELSSVGKRSGSGQVPSRTSVRSDGGVAVTPLTNGSNREQEVRVSEHSESTRAGGYTPGAPKDQKAVVEKLGSIPPMIENSVANMPLNSNDDRSSDKQ
ncbi:hypothetical protein BS17DRAFT_880821 [Gyrodon lividus]|nr:hypothetical protein BS17DRAFT_880821 [Gyrodon lividus]